MAELAAKSSTIEGILWHQGESDCPDDRYAVYEEKLTIVLDTLRKRLNLCNIPLIVGELGEFLSENLIPYYQNYLYINEATRHYAQKTALTACVSSKGLTHNNDHLHFNSRSLYNLGLRYFDAFSDCRKSIK